MIIICTLTTTQKETATEFLEKIKPYLCTNMCYFKPSTKNKIFDRKYGLKHNEKVELIKSLTADDCIKIEPNNNPRYEDAEVFVFLKNDIEITIFGEPNSVSIYIKIYYLSTSQCDKIICISFHESGMHE